MRYLQADASNVYNILDRGPPREDDEVCVKLVGCWTHYPELFDLQGAIAVGLIALALSPGGTTSNMFSLLSRGDMPLSIFLTAVTSLITPFTIPLVLAPTMLSMMGESRTVALPVGQTVVQLLAITVLPVALGMLIRQEASNP